MLFCADCRHRSVRCLKNCQWAADGKHLWAVMRDDMMRGRPPMAHEPVYETLPADVQHALAAGARAMREMAR